MGKHSSLEAMRRHFLGGIGNPSEAPFVVDDFQQAAIQSVANSQDTLVVAPTGSGKTYIAMEAIWAFLMQKQKAVYTTPLKALSNTKYTELKRRFGSDHKVGLLTGDRKIEGDADIVVATTEIYRNELYRSFERYSLVILDELHFIADPQRGPVWEESIILTPSSATLLMLSASISNYDEIAEWLGEVRGKPCNVIVKKERPVELRLGFLHPEFGAIPLRDEEGILNKEITSFYHSFDLDSSGRRLRRRGRPSFRGGGARGRERNRERGRGRR